MTLSIKQLNDLSLLAFPRLFSSLEPPVPPALRGLYRGTLVGPPWLRSLGGPLLGLTGLGGWWGKDFDAYGRAVNLVRRSERIERIFPMTQLTAASLVDGRPVLALHYDSVNPFPWPWIVDELRLLAPGLLLGLTFARLLHRLPLPFILETREAVDGL